MKISFRSGAVQLVLFYICLCFTAHWRCMCLYSASVCYFQRWILWTGSKAAASAALSNVLKLPVLWFLVPTFSTDTYNISTLSFSTDAYNISTLSYQMGCGQVGLRESGKMKEVTILFISICFNSLLCWLLNFVWTVISIVFYYLFFQHFLSCFREM